MEYSFYSAPATAAGECSEESGWTAYFQDLSDQVYEDEDEDDDQQQQHQQQHSLGATSASMVSDAASHAASITHRSNIAARGSSFGESPKTPFKSSFKRSRTKQVSASCDDSLEDTASSPVNSPKIGGMRPGGNHMNSSKTNDHCMDISVGKGGNSEYYSEVVSKEERRMMMMGVNGKNDQCIDLKKRGLCLVPLSMLVNYLG